MSDSAPGKNSSGCGTRVFGIFWTAFSSIFLVAGLWITWGGIIGKTWQKLPCTISKFEIVDNEGDDPAFRADLAYTYESGGTRYTGTRLWKSKQGSDHYEDLAELREPLMVGPEGPRSSPEGASGECYVNPANPAESCLIKDGGGEIIGGLAFAAFGGLFVLIGLVMIFGSKSSPVARSDAGQQEAAKGAPLVIVLGFFAIFGLAGFAVLFGLIVPKAVEWAKMRGWQETTAEIVRGKVHSKSDSDGTSYALDLLYRYEIKGREYRSNRYDILGGSSGGHKGKTELIAQHPPGSKLQVFVDPAKPWRAVVKRNPGWWALFALFPLPFIAVGVGGVWMTLRNRNKPPAVSSASASSKPRSVAIHEGQALASGKWEATRVKPGCTLAGILFAAIFWNGIVGVFIHQDIKMYREGSSGMGMFLSLFLIPFVAVGLIIIGAVVHTFISLFGPAYEIQLEKADLHPGDSTRLRWRRARGRGSVRNFSLFLIGREEATYRQGSSTSTAKSVFHEEVLFETSSALSMDQGHVELRIPAGGVPTFTAKHNRIRWLLVLKAEVASMPDVCDEREIQGLRYQAMSTLTLTKHDYRPGETLSGRAGWDLSTPPGKLELRLFWHTRGRGSEEAETIATRALGQTERGETEFSFELPSAPWSVDGKLVSVCWAVELVDEKSGGIALAEFEMSPTGKAISLGAIENPKSTISLSFWKRAGKRKQT